MGITRNNLCIIPARGGSRRIPRKNIKDFLGKPIIAYSIEAALGSGLFSEVMVSTDDSQIAEVAQEYGASIPFLRSEKAADDFATTMDVVNEVTRQYKIINREFESVCCIYATAPFVSADHLLKSYQVFNENKFDSVFPVMPFSFPIQRALRINDNMSTFINREFINSRSQDLEPTFHDAGQFYWLSKSLAEKNSTMMTDNTGAYIISELEGQDIDNETDWKLAELKYELLQGIK